METSSSTGKPKGVIHTTGGYLLGAAMTVNYVFDVHTHDKFACTADIGWITSHTYIVYGPLVPGVSTSVRINPCIPNSFSVLANRAKAPNSAILLGAFYCVSVATITSKATTSALFAFWVVSENRSIPRLGIGPTSTLERKNVQS